MTIAPIIPLFAHRPPAVATPVPPPTAAPEHIDPDQRPLDELDDATLCAIMAHGGPAADAAANVLLVRHHTIDGARAVLRALRGGAA
jgi:hypothetical protein